MAGEQGSVGFGLGQMLQQGGMGGQMAQPAAAAQGTGLMGILSGLLGGQQGGAGLDMSKLGPLMQMLQMQQANGQLQHNPAAGVAMGPMAGQGGVAGGQTQAQRGYLAQGGGIQPRQVVNRF